MLTEEGFVVKITQIRFEGENALKKNWIFLVLGSAFVVLLGACAPVTDTAPRPESDSSQAYGYDARTPVDDNVYEIAGVVTGAVDSLVRQTEAARGSVAGSGYGFYGTYFGSEFGGKGFVRLLVRRSNSPLAPIGEIVILKTTDTKAIVLVPGDEVTFLCRAQYEAVAAVRDNETFDPDKVETWELDYCRLLTPVIQAGQ